MNLNKKKQAAVENEKTTAEVTTPTAVPKVAPKAAKKAPARAKKAQEKTATPAFASRRVWPD